MPHLPLDYLTAEDFTALRDLRIERRNGERVAVLTLALHPAHPYEQAAGVLLTNAAGYTAILHNEAATGPGACSHPADTQRRRRMKRYDSRNLGVFGPRRNFAVYTDEVTCGRCHGVHYETRVEGGANHGNVQVRHSEADAMAAQSWLVSDCRKVAGAA